MVLEVKESKPKKTLRLERPNFFARHAILVKISISESLGSNPIGKKLRAQGHAELLKPQLKRTINLSHGILCSEFFLKSSKISPRQKENTLKKSING
jgi:hypothetical protein